MANSPKGNGSARDLPPVTDYGARAAAALDELIPGQHRDKTVARLFDVSVRMAKYLRSGRYWTAERLSQASRCLGADFDIRLAAPSAEQICRRIERMEQEIAAIRERALGEGRE